MYINLMLLKRLRDRIAEGQVAQDESFAIAWRITTALLAELQIQVQREREQAKNQCERVWVEWFDRGVRGGWIDRDRAIPAPHEEEIPW